jgi:integrase
MTIGRVWRRARQAAFTAEAAASPLAKTPYDLRHAAVSTWLNGGVPPTTVAEWAGHSVEVFLGSTPNASTAVTRWSAVASKRHWGTSTLTPRRLPADYPGPCLEGV